MTTETKQGTTEGRKKGAPSLADKAAGKVDDLLEKASGPTMRAGLSTQRISAMVGNGIDPRVLKTQLDVSSERLGNNHTYSLGFITELSNFFDDCKRGTPVSKRVTKGLIQDQKAVDEQDKDSMDA